MTGKNRLKQPGQRYLAGNLAWVVGLAALALSGCSTLARSPSPEGTAAMANQYVDRGFRGTMLVSRITPVRLGLKGGWQAAPAGSLNPSADLEAVNSDQNLFLVVLGEDRAAVAPGTLDEQATNYLQILKSGFTQMIDDEARTKVESINNFPAVQYEVRGNVGQNPVAYLHTTIEMGDHYYQVVVWTPDDLRMANADAMESVVKEFSEAPL